MLASAPTPPPQPLTKLLLQISAPRSNILFRAVHLVSPIVGPRLFVAFPIVVAIVVAAVAVVAIIGVVVVVIVVVVIVVVVGS